jgi:HPr kinase/phosphorylase
MPDIRPVILHATAVAFGPAGLLILGKSGSGKSTLALQLIGLGATLVADDRVVCAPQDGALKLSAPDPIRDRIEARGLGLLAVPSAPAMARAAVEMERAETARLPAPREIVIAGVTLPALPKLEGPAFPAILRLYLEGGLAE